MSWSIRWASNHSPLPDRIGRMVSAFLLLSAPAMGATVPSVDQSAVGASLHPADAAVVIGNEDYAYLQDVPFATRDAQAFRDWVVRGRGVPDSRVRLLVNVSHASMLDAIEAAAIDVQAGGVLWVYYAGHGAGAVRPDGSTERSLVGKSAEADANTLGEFVLRLSEIESVVARSQASQVVVILDACYANADRSGNPLLGGRFVVPDYASAPVSKVSVWTGASSTEVAEGYDAAQHGLFTYFVIAALQGQADGVNGTRDGQVTLDEATTWTTEAVRIVGEYRQNPAITTDPANRTVVLGNAARGLVPMDLPALPKAKAASGATALKAELERLRRDQEAAKADAARLAAENEEKTAVARQNLLTEASAAWGDVQALAQDPGDAAEVAVRRFIEVYERSTITVDGVAQAIEVPEIAQALELLKDLERHSKSAVPHEGRGFPWLLTTGGVVGLAGAGALVYGGVQEQAYANRAESWTAQDAEARQSSINTVYVVGYGLLSAGLVTGAFEFLDVTPGVGLRDGAPLWTLSGRW